MHTYLNNFYYDRKLIKTVDKMAAKKKAKKTKKAKAKKSSKKRKR